MHDRGADLEQVSKRYPDELVQRAVRVALVGNRPVAQIARDLGIHPEALRKRVRQAEIPRPRRENYELRRLKSASVVSPRSSTPDRPK